MGKPSLPLLSTPLDLWELPFLKWVSKIGLAFGFIQFQNLMEMRKPFQSCEWKKCRGETKDCPWHGISLRKLNILHCQNWYSLSMPFFLAGRGGVYCDAIYWYNGQEMVRDRDMDITRCSILKSDWLYSLQSKMEKLYRVSKNKTGSWVWLRSWTSYCQIQT